MVVADHAPHTDDDARVERARLAALARYDVLDDEPLGSLDRVARLAARLLDAPIATVTLVDDDRIWFKAGHGSRRLTHTGREPGLAASAIGQDEPYVVRDALNDPRTARHPLVTGDPGVRFYAAAPITTLDGHRLGTVDVYDTCPRDIGARELEALSDLAGVVIDELELRLSALTTVRAERSRRQASDRTRATMEGFAATLQRTLLPPSLPNVPGLELACHYHAASPQNVTGDFYDVFSLGDGRWAFFLGDVSGHGASAASVTSLTRYTLRAAALHHTDPAAALAELNTALLIDPHVRQQCTVLFGLLRTTPEGGFDITLASGGHPPALKLGPGPGVVEPICPDGGMLAGAFPDAEFATCRTYLRPGQTLLLYTDGLTEARPGGKFFGEDGLADFCADRGEAGAVRLIGELTALIGGFRPPPADDVALLALHAPHTASGGEPPA
ncbi:SpoIIE family protein phosphatase [Saccharopolyspora erythraea]|nr:SpoIIE family protein phosphatase [Saccharopolyspora erythraea]